MHMMVSTPRPPARRWLARGGLSLAIAAGAALSAPAPAEAATRVAFVMPARFADADVPGALGEIRRHLERLGERLDPRLTLRIAILDVDLAGRESFGQGPLAPRILDRVSWPSIAVRYTLGRSGKIVASGEDRITDRTYDMRPGLARASGDPLRFEKAMLDRWFDERFGSHRAGTGPSGRSP